MTIPDKDIILSHFIKERAKTQPERDVVTFVDVAPDGSFLEQQRSYKGLWENGLRFADALEKAGMGKQDAFGIIMQNHAEFVDAMVGSAIAGTIFVPIDPRVKGKKLVHMLGFSECKGAMIADYALPYLKEIITELPLLEWVWVLGDGDGIGGIRCRNIADILAQPVPAIDIKVNDPSAPMQMLFTSGTTGDPKGILSPYERLAVGQMMPGILGLDKSDCLYTGLSLTHANAQLLTLMVGLYGGIPCVISRKFTKSRLWDITRRYDCTMFNLLGGMITGIYSEAERPADADNPVRMVLSAGMPAALWESFQSRFGVEIYEIYGAAEGGLTFNPPRVGPIGSIGKPPASMELKIIDEDGNECAPGEPGEIVFRNSDGTSPIVKYFKNPEASEAKTRGGWLHMADIGYVDEDGWVYFMYRDGGGIRRNGDFVNSAFVEKELAEQAEVNDVFVYGVAVSGGAPGEKEVVAAIVPVNVDNFDPNAVFASCRSNLEANFVPRFIQVVEEIPKTASEKPIERFLLEVFRTDAPNVFEIT